MAQLERHRPGTRRWFARLGCLPPRDRRPVDRPPRGRTGTRRCDHSQTTLGVIAVHRFLGELDTEAGQFDAAEEHLQESMALAEACAAPFERALTLFEIARLRLAQGRSDEARSLLAEVRDICEPLGARPTLEKVTALEQELEAPDA